VYCPGGATLYRKSIKKDGSTRYCNKKLCKQCPYRNKCVTSKKYPWKEIDFSKDCLEKKANWWEDSMDKSAAADEDTAKNNIKDTASDDDIDINTKNGSVSEEKMENLDWAEPEKNKKPSFRFEKKIVVRFKLRPNREKMDKRKCTSEHPFGTIKRWHNSGYFLLKGMRKVDGEFALFSIGYNLSRAENMYTFEELMEKVGRKTA
jgi:transposase